MIFLIVVTNDEEENDNKTQSYFIKKYIIYFWGKSNAYR
jgi:hypothetical protein